MSSAPGDDPILEALWERARADLEADEPHRAVLEHARMSEQLPELARRYRALPIDGEETQAAIARRLAQLTAVALTFVATHRATSPESPPRPRWLVALAMLVLAVALYGLYAAAAAY
ncbi:MAG: hypothetical protein FJ095_12955 [Deltaproteobacteria bacterium]|nr:hypothetical protein [Deltaproteobacteria bacterium]